MRRFLLATLLVTGAGCQALHERKCDDACPSNETGLLRKRHLLGGLCHDCEPKQPCAPAKKEAAPPPRAPAAPPPAAPPEAAAPVVSQDILLVPKTVYVPYAAQTPTAPARLMSAPPPPPQSAPPPPQSAPPPPEQPKPTAPAPTAPAPPERIPGPKEQIAPPNVPCDVTMQMLEICKKLNHRLDCLEKQQAERINCPPTLAPCAPAAPLIQFPLFRRPLFGRSEPLQLCEPCPPATTPQPQSRTANPPPATVQPTPPVVIIE